MVIDGEAAQLVRGGVGDDERAVAEERQPRRRGEARGAAGAVDGAAITDGAGDDVERRRRLRQVGRGPAVGGAERVLGRDRRAARVRYQVAHDALRLDLRARPDSVAAKRIDAAANTNEVAVGS